MSDDRGSRRPTRAWSAVVASTVVAVLLSGCGVLVNPLDLPLPWPGRPPVAQPTPGTSGPPPTTASPPTATPTPSASSAPTSSASNAPTPPAVPRATAPIPDVTPEGFRAPPAGLGLQRYTAQQVDWVACGNRLECAEVAVPLDYAAPDAEAITLGVKRFRGGTGVRGSLFLNPGGPGGSGFGMVENYTQAFDGQYDVVGWDPRGVGHSTPVRCMNGPELDAFFGLDSTPDDPAERQALLDGTREFTASCLARSGRLLQHVSTVETVRDLDVLRQLVGDDELNFLGFSYGTQIGATYAQLFGKNVGRMVLDSAVNITDDTSIIQAQGFDRSLTAFAEWCGQGNCAFGTRDETIAAIKQLWDDLDARPLAVGDRQLTQSLAALGTLTPLYQDESVWPYLRDGLAQAMRGDGTELLRFSDIYNERDQQGQYGSIMFAFNAVRCLDEADPGVEAIERRARQDAQKAPMFGVYLGVDLICPSWPVAAQPPLGTLTAPDAPPILVVGTTGDSATPYEYARSMAAQLTSGTLLTLDGEGHGAFGGASQCINRAVLSFFASGEPPPDGTVCT